jgi:AraC-like DNA-binding protein
MLTTDEALSQIALACGLCDHAHFSRLFRRVLGISPNMWRRQWLGSGPQRGRASSRATGGQCAPASNVAGMQ